MKLHLPKGLRAALLVACAAFSAHTAAAATVTYNDLLNSSDGWTFGSARGRSNTISIDGGTLSSNGNNWGQLYASYTFTDTLQLQGTADTLDFSFTLVTQGSVNAGITMTLKDTGVQNVTVGSAYNSSPIRYGVSTADGITYSFNGKWDAGNSIAVTPEDTALSSGNIAANTTYAISGHIAYSEGQFVLTMTCGDITGTVNLGESLDFDQLVFCYDGQNANDNPTISNWAMSYMSSAPSAAEYVWNPTSGNAWDTSTSNWLKDGSQSTFESGTYSHVTFRAETAQKTVAVGMNITAGTATVNGAYAFAMSGDSTLSLATLNMQASSSLALSGAGSVQVKAATLGTDAAVSVAEGTNLVLAGSGAVTTLLTTATGAGNAVVTAGATIVGGSAEAPVASMLTGSLTVGGSATLVLGNNYNTYIDFSSFSSVKLEGGSQLHFKQHDMELQNVSVASGTAVIKFLDTPSKDLETLRLTGTTALDGTLKIQTDWKMRMAIEKLSGTGVLEVNCGGSETRNVIIEGTEDTFGTLKLNSATTITLKNQGSITSFQTDDGSSGGNIIVDEGAEWSAANFSNSWGLSTITVNGVLNVSGQLIMSSGNVTNTVAGSGVINTARLEVGNVGKYVFDGTDGLSINIGASGITKGTQNGYNATLKEGVTIGASADWSTEQALILGTNGAVFNTEDSEGTGHTVTLSGVLSGDGSLTKDGEGTLVLGAANTHTGGTAITAGVVQVGNAAGLGAGDVSQAGGELKVSAGVAMGDHSLVQTDGAITVDEGASLSLGTATLHSAIDNSGTVTFNGATTLTMEEQTQAAGYINEDGEDDEHDGFAKGASKYLQVVNVAEGSTSSAEESASFLAGGNTYDSTAYDAETGRVVTQTAAETDWSVFEINQDSHDLSAIQTASQGHDSSIATVKMTGGTLNVDSQALAGGVIETSGGTVSLTQGVGTVKVGAASDLILSGSGVISSLVVGDSATIGGDFNASAFSVVAGKTATVKESASLGSLAVEGTLALQGAAQATGGAVNALSTEASSSLSVAESLALTSATGSGDLSVTGALTLKGAVELGNVTAGSVVLESGSSLTLSGNLDSAEVSLATVSSESVMLTAAGLASSTGTNFTVNADMVAALNLEEGQTVTLAKLSDSYSGTLKVNNAGFVYRSGDQLSYAISQDAASHAIILTAQSMKGEFVWDDESGDGNWGTGTNWAGNEVPTAESWVQVDQNASINMDVAGEADRLTVYGGAAVVLSGSNPLDVKSLLEVNKDAELAIGEDGDATAVSVPEVVLDGTLTVAEGASLEADSISMTAGTLNTEAGSSVSTGVLTGDADSVLSGPVTVTGKGTRYQGNYAGATVAVAKGGDAVLYAGDGLTLAGAGSTQLVYTQDTAISGIQADGLTLALNNAAADNSGVTLALEEGSSLKNGKILTGLSAVGTAATIDSAEAPTLVSTTASPLKRSAGTPGLDLTGSTVVLTQSEGSDVTQMVVNNGGKTKGLVLAYLGGDNTNAAVQLNGNLFAKYYKNARLQGGSILVDMNDTYYQGLVRPTTANGRAGAAMLDDAFVYVNPQQTRPDSDLAKVMDALENGAVRGSAADRAAAAVSGASAAAMGAAFGADVDRQLRAIRNRTTSMGCAECVVNENMPYVNAWVNAEGDYRKLDADNTLAGYKMSSWGATLGMDLDFTNRFTAGLAVTAMQGDFTADSADTATGDLDRLYLSAFARYSRRAWTHTAVATFGKADANLKRTVDYGTGSYTTKGDMSGTAFGLMYEVGYTKALTEDASVCLQPVFNISYRHSALGSYTETGSDAALSMGSREMDTVTFGLGARLQGTVGTSVYNRTSVVELRALAKLDAGDRDCAVKAGIAGLPATHEVQSAEYGAFGLEVGAGLLVPLGEEGGTLFFDAAAELRSGYTNVNGTVGYRFNF